ncbi:hypothetical protein H0E87_005204 [Populus deltoides]|uniref:Uncharacterized protein n=1 Tax=Populus deltoides TaxID=3696 RepID=A0A8T2ZIE2_POPDE|nr:hypothetical protein H0E87_005204 [Populus deltoides]
MALVIYWYDIVCFGIVAASFVVSLWVLWRRDLASKCDDNFLYQSLLVARPDINDRTVLAMPRNHVGSTQLWTSCWKGVHPGWLLATRFISFLVMAGLLWMDIVDWDATIFIYYTEWTFMLIMIYFALGTVISAYGCWVSLKQPAVSEHGENSVFLKRDVEEDGTATSITYKEKKSGGLVIKICLLLICLMGCMHSLNAVFLLLDTALNSLPFPWFRLAYFVQWSCLYVIFQWVIHACGFTWWPYPFLELNTPWAPLCWMNEYCPEMKLYLPPFASLYFSCFYLKEFPTGNSVNELQYGKKKLRFPKLLPQKQTFQIVGFRNSYP